MPRFICLLVLIVMVLQSCGSPTMDTKPESTVISAIQPSVVSTTTPPQRYPNLPSAPMRTPQSVVLTPTQAQSSEQAFPPECTYPLYTPAANVPVVSSTLRKYMFSDPAIIFDIPDNHKVALEAWTSDSELLMTLFDFDVADTTIVKYDIYSQKTTTVFTNIERAYFRPLFSDDGQELYISNPGDSQHSFVQYAHHSKGIDPNIFSDAHSFISRGAGTKKIAYVDHDQHLIVVSDLHTSAKSTRRSSLPLFLQTKQGIAATSQTNGFVIEQHLVWSPDQELLFAYSPYGAFMIDPNTETTCMISITGLSEYTKTYAWVLEADWRTDGRMLALRATTGQELGNVPMQLILLDLLTGEQHDISIDEPSINNVEWIGKTGDLLVSALSDDSSFGYLTSRFFFIDGVNKSSSPVMSDGRINTSLYRWGGDFVLSDDGRSLAWLCVTPTSKDVCLTKIEYGE